MGPATIKYYGIFLAALFLGLPGCFQLGPEYKRPEFGFHLPKEYHEATAERILLIADSSWWKIFGDAELNALVEEALSNNWSLKRATARILEFKARHTMARSDRFPNLNFGGGYNRGGTNGFSISGSDTSEAYTVSAPASFEIDLWGRLAAESEAAKLEILQQEENRRALAQTIIAETIQLYLELEHLERRLQITRESVESFRNSLKIVQSRYNRGLSSILAVRQARRILTDAEARIPQLLQNIGIKHQMLSVILGRYPESKPPRLHPESYYTKLIPVPPGLPSNLLLQRPDLRATEAGLQALNKRIAVAKAARFPSISLTGSLGYASDALKDLIRTGNGFWSMSGNITQSVFNAGDLKANQTATEARYQQESARYIETILNAFAEVESALLTRKMQLERRERILLFLDEARATQRIAQNRYLRGLINYLDVLDAQQARFFAEERLVQVDLTILSNRVALHRALGGSW